MPNRSLLRQSPWEVLLASVTIAVACLAVYSNTFHVPFLFDDESAIVTNRSIERLWPPSRALLVPPVGPAVQRRPVVNVSLAVNHAISGRDVWSYHALNLGAHILAALLLFGVVRRTLLPPSTRASLTRAATPLAASAAMLWAVHPLQTEAVTYVIQRTEVLAGLFCLLTLYCTIRGTTSRLPAVWYAVAVAACALAMGSKESALFFPLVVLLYDRVFLSASWRAVLVRRWGLYLGLAASWSVVLVMLPRGMEGTAVLGQEDRAFRYAIAQCGVIAHYLQLCFWPYPQVFDYGLYKPQSLGQIIPNVTLIGGLFVATAVALRRQPWLGFLGVWFFAILAPSSSIVPLFQQVAAEKRMYLPLAAVVTGVVVGGYLVAQWLVGRGTVRLRTAAITGTSLVTIACIALGIVAHRRNWDYRSELAIWEDTVSKAPGNERAHYNLGLTFNRLGQPDKAIGCYRQAVEIKPDFARAHNNLGAALQQKGRNDEAILHFNEALKLDPDDADTHNNLGVALTDRGQLDEAIAHYERAVEIRPDFADAHNGLGGLLFQKHKLEDAMAHFCRAVELKPESAEAHNNLGAALAMQGRLDEAIAQFEKTLELKPDHSGARQNLERVRLRK
jgi:Flp pilus assembly protein TadD